ncbi:hypothetical protein D3C72_1719080 [compost metagenome]
MVHCHQKHVFLRCAAQQRGAPQRRLVEREGPGRVLTHGFAQRRVAGLGRQRLEVGHRQADPGSGIDAGERLAVVVGMGGAQDLVAGGDGAQGMAQRCHIQRPAQAQRAGHVVGGTGIALQALDQPQPLLRQ